MPVHDVSVVVPVHDGSATLAELTARHHAVLLAHAGAFELVFVDDASTDGSWTCIERLAAEHGWVRGIRLAANVGQHAALLCGIDHARHAVVATLDDDLQHPPEELPKLLAAFDAGVDLVYGASHHPDQGPLRRLAAHAARRLLARDMGPAALRASAFRCVRRDLVAASGPRGSGPSCLDRLLADAGARVRVVPVRFDPRRGGRSRYGAVALLALLAALVVPRRGRARRGSREPYRACAFTPPAGSPHAPSSSARRGSAADRTA